MITLNRFINGPVIVAPIVIGASLSGIFYLAEGMAIPLTIFQLTLITGLLLFLFKKISTQDLKLELYGLEIEYILFLALIFFSLIYSPERSQGLFYAIRFIILLAMTYVIYNSVTSQKELKTICYVFIGIAVVIALYNIVDVYFNPEIAAFNYVNQGTKLMRSEGPESDPNVYASYYFLPLMLLIAYIGESKSLRKRISFFGVAALLLAAILLSYSRSAWISIFFGGVFIMIYQRKFSFLVYAALTLFAVILVSETVQNLILSILTRLVDIFAGSSDDSSRFRIILGKTSILIWLDSYLFGIGFQGFSTVFQKYYPTQETAGIYEPHNEYLAVLAELGLLGFLVFVAILIKILRFGWRELKDLKAQNKNTVFQLGLFASFMCYLLFYQFYAGMLYNSLFFINIALFLVGKKINHQERIHKYSLSDS